MGEITEKTIGLVPDSPEKLENTHSIYLLDPNDENGSFLNCSNEICSECDFAIEGDNATELFREKLRFFHRLVMVYKKEGDPGHITPPSPAQLEINAAIERVFESALKKRGGSILLRIIVTFYLESCKNHNENSNDKYPLIHNLRDGWVWVVSPDSHDTPGAEPGIYIIDETAPTLSMQQPWLSSRDRISYQDIVLGSGEGFDSAGFYNELQITLSPEILGRVQEFLQCDLSQYSVLEVCWILEYVKVLNQGGLLLFDMDRGTLAEHGLWGSVLRCTALAQGREGFDVLEKLKHILFLILHDEETKKAQEFLSRITSRLDELYEISSQLSVVLSPLLTNDKQDTFRSHMSRKLLFGLHKSILSIDMNEVASGKHDVLQVFDQLVHSRILVARELITMVAKDPKFNPKILESLLQCSVDMRSVADLSLEEKEEITTMFVESREGYEFATPEQKQQSIDATKVKLNRNDIDIAIVRNKDGEIYGTLFKEYYEPIQGYYLSGGAINKHIPKSLNGIVSKIIGDFVIGTADKPCRASVYRDNLAAYNMYKRLYKVTENPENSNDEVLAFTIALKE